jgi:hypothetical protein
LAWAAFLPLWFFRASPGGSAGAFALPLPAALALSTALASAVGCADVGSGRFAGSVCAEAGSLSDRVDPEGLREGRVDDAAGVPSSRAGVFEDVAGAAGSGAVGAASGGAPSAAS